MILMSSTGRASSTISFLKCWLTSNYGYLLTALFCFIFLFHYYGEILLHPNDYMMSSTGDGLKNYYTLAYHLKHDTSVGHFSGMHYPYGDHVIYTDGQPFLGLMLSIFPGAAGYSVGIVNLLMLLSMVVSGLVIFRIFRLFELPQIGASLAAFSIVLLSPQIWRIGGHYSLAYAFVVPLAILWLIQAIQSKKIKYSIYLGILALVFLYTHPYLGMMSVFMSGIAFIALIIHENNYGNIKTYYPLLLSTFSPVVLFTLINLFFESHPNRPGVPIGFFQAHATFESVFIPNHPPFKDMMSKIIKIENQPWSGWAYIGLTAFISLLIYPIIAIYKAIKNKAAKKLLIPFPNPFNYLLIAGILLLLFSMCLPFKWGLEHLVDYIGPLRQFRALGRFAWPFFYIITIWSFIMMHRHIKRKEILLTLIILGATLNIIEGREQHYGVRDLVEGHPNKFLEKNLTKGEKQAIDLINKTDCVAMISLPFFHVGAEYFVHVGSEASLFNTILFSYHTGLPSFNSLLGRTSIDETIQINSLFTPDFLDKPIMKDLDLNKSVLILEHPGTPMDEVKVLRNATFIDEVNGIKFYKNKLSNIFESNYDELVNSSEFKNMLNQPDGTLRSIDNKPCFFENFEESGQSSKAYQGSKSYTGIKKRYHIFPVSQELLDNHDTLTASFWYNCEDDMSTTNIMCYVVERDSSHQHKVIHDPKAMREIRFLDRSWGLMTLDFVATNKDYIYNLIIKGEDEDKTSFYIDNMMFYGRNGVYLKENGQVYYNNYPISP